MVDALDITDLLPVEAVETALWCPSSVTGRVSSHEAGSFGDPQTLLALSRRVQTIAATAPDRRPVTVLPQEGSAMTVDSVRTPTPRLQGRSDDGLPSWLSRWATPPGSAPEVVVAALLDDRVPLVVPTRRHLGDLRRLRAAADVLGLEPEFVDVDVDHVAAAPTGPGRICVVDLGLIPDDLPWGQLSSVAGDAAFQYIRVASELAVDGAVQAICTAPLNKEALQPPDTSTRDSPSLWASDGTAEVSMMLSTPKLRVITCSDHAHRVLDAVARIEQGLVVERTIRRGHEGARNVPDP